ncbi:hypothetical protein P3S67_014678 [Capsicum chacoense]
MVFSRALSQISRNRFSRCQWLFSSPPHQQLPHSYHIPASQKVLGCRVIHSWVSNALSGIGQQIHHQSTAVAEV